MFDIVTGRMLALTPKILPAVYEDAMTYYEQLGIVNDKLTEVIDVVNSFGTTVLDASMQYTDSKVGALATETQAQLEDLRNQINTLSKTLYDKIMAEVQEELDSALAEFKETSEKILEEFVTKVAEFNQRMDELQIAINTLFDALERSKLEMRQQMQREIDKIIAYLDDAVAAKLGRDIIVVNPVTKTNSSLDKALQDIFLWIYNVFGITASEYKALQLTAQEYKEKDITAIEYIMHGKLIFFREMYFPTYDEDFEKVYDYINDLCEAQDKQHYMISPFDGKWTPIKTVVYSLARLHMRGITAEQYQNALLTADAYKAKNIGAHDYAWNGYYLIYTDATPVPTLEEQIGQLQVALAGVAERVTALESGATEPSYIKQMQDDINAGKKKNDEQDVEIASNTTNISNVADAVNTINETTIPALDTKIEGEIDSLHEMLTTVDQGLQTQISTIQTGLTNININYGQKTTKTVKKARKK